MPPIPFRQPRARRATGLGLVGAVALTVALSPAVLGATADSSTEATGAAVAPTTVASTLPAIAKISLRSDVQPEATLAATAATPEAQMAAAYANATPEERTALDKFFSPPPAPQPAATSPKAPAVSGGSVWDRVATCESHNNWATHTASGFSGGLQFADQTWRSYGGSAFAPKAWQASREQQIVVAERVLHSVGWKAWPACSRKLGLR